MDFPYYGMDGKPITQDEAMQLFGDRSKERQVAETKIGDVTISTVLLVIDHSFGRGKPLIFETMIFGGDHDQEQWRYHTRKQAENGHVEAVKLVRGG